MRRRAGLRILAVLFCWLAALAGAAGAHASVAPATPAFGHAAIVQRDGEPTLVLDGKPVFFWGAAFFYERLPATQWHSSMLELKRLGVTTLDLYVPWNWHEIADGEFDFDGHTNPRRNLREVLRLGRELGFTFIVRPGPVIRNEWRNGGYPAWLLTRPEYGMPLHDVLEGRYPATATLQNAHSDDAAAEWMRNSTHLRYASRWLHRALEEFRPVADRVLAVQLDDDQGAYIDNQTYPAPHLQRYLRWLESQVREVVGPSTPTFINTYEMRVPAWSPVWTMGNWYQSDAYAIGEHDRLALDLATAMLRTNRRGPLAVSEFQAGWLAQPEDPQPRAADPTNTTLALYELLGWGVHGVTDFPMQDTLAPFGWEAPFSNALYAWDAALTYPANATLGSAPIAASSIRSPRYGPTWEFGQVVHTFGPLLAESHRIVDVAIAYPGSTYPGEPAPGIAALGRFRESIHACRARGTPCDIVDLAFTDERSLRAYRTLIVSDAPTRRVHAALLQAFHAGGGQVASHIPAEHLPGAILRGPDATFLVASNWKTDDEHDSAGRVRIGAQRFDIPPLTVEGRSARLIPLDLRLARLDARYGADLRLGTSCELAVEPDGIFLYGRPASCEFALRGRARSTAGGVARDGRTGIRFDGSIDNAQPRCCTGVGAFFMSAVAVRLSPLDRVFLSDLQAPAGDAPEIYRGDVFGDGARNIVLQNRFARAIVVPDGGARVPVFQLLPVSIPDRNWATGSNAFDATGASRDSALFEGPASTTDRIARYTHSYPAGTYNRAYTVTSARDGSVKLSVDIPDVVPSGARFERSMSLAPDAARLIVDERAQFFNGKDCERQRAVILSAMSLDPEGHGTGHGRVYDRSALVTNGGILDAPSGIALIQRTIGDPRQDRFVVAISWRPGDVESASWTPQRSNGTLRMVLAPGWRRVTYAMTRAKTAAEADAFVEAERAWVAANPAPISEDGEVAKRYTQSPQKRPSVSSCGFESHLPQ